MLFHKNLTATITLQQQYYKCNRRKKQEIRAMYLMSRTWSFLSGSQSNLAPGQSVAALTTASAD